MIDVWPVVFNWLYRNDLKLIDSYNMFLYNRIWTNIELLETFDSSLMFCWTLPDLGNSLFLSISLEHNIIYLSVSLFLALTHKHSLSDSI